MIILLILLLFSLIGLSVIGYRYLKLKQAIPLVTLQLKKDTTLKTAESELAELTELINHKLERFTIELKDQQASAVANQKEHTLQLQQLKQTAQQEQQALATAIENFSIDTTTQLTAAKTELKLVEQDHYAQQIQKNLDRATNQLADLQLYQRLAIQSLHVSQQTLDLTKLLKTTLQDYYDALQKQNFRLALQLTSNVTLQSDPELIQRILTESLTNVLDHGEAEVRINLTKDKHFAYLTIQNQSLPIQNLKRLTAPFYTEQVHSDKTAGLGLYFISELTQLTNGILTLTYDKPVFTLQISWRLE